MSKKMPVSGKKFFGCEEGPLIEGSEDGEEEKVLSKWSVCHETSYILVNRITSGNLVYHLSPSFILFISSNLKLPKIANLEQKGQVGPKTRQF